MEHISMNISTIPYEEWRRSAMLNRLAEPVQSTSRRSHRLWQTSHHDNTDKMCRRSLRASLSGHVFDPLRPLTHTASGNRATLILKARLEIARLG